MQFPSTNAHIVFPSCVGTQTCPAAKMHILFCPFCCLLQELIYENINNLHVLCLWFQKEPFAGFLFNFVIGFLQNNEDLHIY